MASTASTSRSLPDLPFVPPVRKTAKRDGNEVNGNGSGRGKGKAVATITLDSGSDDDGGESDGVHEDSTGEYEEDITESSEALARLDQELLDITEQIHGLQQLYSTLGQERSTLQRELQARRKKAPIARAPATVVKKPAGAVDFYKQTFSWKKEIKDLAKETWNIDGFRMCQEPALNATLSGRDLMVVMPTGGGKSLIYQLPSLLEDGTTVVVTPLISLMQDQTYNLRAVGVRAEMLNAATSQSDARTIMKRLVTGGLASSLKGKGKSKAAQLSVDEDEREIKLEKIDKSKTWVSTLQKMYDAGRLARIVIDEAHCCSSMGHDYRTSYLALGKLKTLFPSTPVTALTATAPESVIADVLKILHMPRKTSPGDAALENTTVLFTAPLYRANLHYSCLPRPKEADGAIDAVVEYILSKHVGDQGIIYALSRADTEKICLGVNSKSKGKIRCAVYHSGVSDAEKLAIHKQWRLKQIHCVVATNAFGLGIDSPECRYVIHHTVSKSIEGYYQESGRAGRDGVDSDCVVFYRSSDASRLSTLTYESFYSGGKEKLYDMLSFCEDLKTCRKLLFARAFSASHASKAAFQEGDAADEECGHCDNCLRDPSTLETIDASEDVYRALRIISAAERQSATLTLMQASDLVRGLGGGSFATQGKQSKGKGTVDVVAEAGGKVSLSKEATESLIVCLLCEGYLREEFHNTAYSTLSYIKTAPNRALRFTRLSPAEVAANGCAVPFEMTIPAKGKKSKAPAKRKASAAANPRVAKKAKALVVSSSDDGELDLALAYGEGLDADDDEEDAMREAGGAFGDFEDDDEDGYVALGKTDGDGWQVRGGTNASSDGFEVIGE
ncbi:hypothetical protein RQP46_006825 [Phenoliferia psychrophenolica]